MRKLLAILLSILMVCAIVPMAFGSADTTYYYDTVIDMSNYDGVTLNQYASPWYTKGLTRSYNISKTDAVYDATLDAMMLKRGTYDPCGLYYFDDSLGSKLTDSLGFRVWIKGDADSGVDTTSDTNLHFAFDTVDETGTHATYGAFWYSNSSYKVKVPADGAWVEIRWADLAKNFRKVGNGMTLDRPSFSGSAAVVDMETIFPIVNGLCIAFKETGANKVYYVGDFQLIYDTPVDEGETTVPTEPEEETTTTTTTTTTTVPSVPSSNLALGKNTVSFSLEDGKYPSSDAVDGKTAEDSENRWASAFVDNAWWVVDLGDVYDVNSIKIYWEGAYSKEYKIQVATDEAAWADVSSKNLTRSQKDETYWTTIYTGGTTKKGLQEIAITEDTVARYVCFQGIKRATTYGNSFYEFEVYGTKANVEKDGETTDIISVKDGASIRLNEANGMRFYATLTGESSDVDEMGFIIAPKDIVEGEYFTMDDDHIKVKYDHKNYPLWAENQFVGSIVNVADKNLARDFVARAYVVIDGVTYYSKETTVRNLADVADAYIADTDGGYAELDAETKALVEKWAKAND